jgi:hypothetical protein
VTLVSIIIPYAPYHTSIVEQAIAAARSQSLPCDVIPVEDMMGWGAGGTRNHGVYLSDTLFVYFLDADDTIRPDTIERMVGMYRKHSYVYSDDTQGDSLHQTPDCGAWLDGTWHTVNALVPTAAFRAVGGFDETLPALEDLDFFLRLQAYGVCGVRCPHPLVRYTAGGQRSYTFSQQPDYKQRKLDLYKRWVGAAKMGCNCGAAVSGVVPDGKEDTDILVTALYTPRQMGGSVTGRLYPRPRGANNYQIWVDPRDVEAKPNLWQPVMSIDPNLTPDVELVVRLASEAMGG